MPSDYTGDKALVGDFEDPILPCPIDADPRNASSVTTPFETIANFLAYFMKGPAAAKCWGRVTLAAGTPTLAGGPFNVLSVAADGAYAIKVTFDAPLADANYSVLVRCSLPHATATFVDVAADPAARATTYFEFTFYDAAAANVALSGISTSVEFIVFGAMT